MFFFQWFLTFFSMAFNDFNGFCNLVTLVDHLVALWLQEGLGSNMQDARAKAITRYVQILQWLVPTGRKTKSWEL